MATQVKLVCDMERDCTDPITHIDHKGYIYCRKHGEERKQVCRCRTLTPAELRVLKSGDALVEY